MKEIIEEQLPDDIEELKRTISLLNNSLKFKEKEIQKRDRRIEELLRQLWGKKSEKRSNYSDEYQALLFNEIEIVADTKEDDEESSIIASHTRKKKSNFKHIPDYYHREIHNHELDEKDRTCSCGCVMEHFGDYSRETLIIPKIQPYVKKDVVFKYRCSKCKGRENSGEKPEVIQATLPPTILPQTIASPELLAHAIQCKFEYHMPIYRLEKIYSSLEIPITRNNICNWLVKIYQKINSKFDFLLDYVKSGPVLGIDETPFQVHNEPGKKDTSKSYMWVIRGGPPGKEISIFLYRDNRSALFLTDMLKDYKGFIISDDFASYDSRLGSDFYGRMGKCWSHVRRKFINLAHNKDKNAIQMLDLIARLYKIESFIRDKEYFKNKDFEKIKSIRQEKSKVIIEEIKNLKNKVALNTLHSNGIMDGIRYMENNWEGLVLFIDNPQVLIDNNLVENAIRPFALGRKNWLFSGSPSGAHASAFYYTLINAFIQAKIDRHDGVTELLKYTTHDPAQEEIQKKFWEIMRWSV